MVLFDNVKVGQRVEVIFDGRIFKGTVRFKGCVNGIPGDWVGVDLDKKVGRHEGMVNGRRYFQCPTGHGVFVTANKLRFIRSMRCLYDNYRTVEQEPLALVDHELFADESRDDLLYDFEDCDDEAARSSHSSLSNRNYSPLYPPPFPPSHSFHRSHSVGRRLPAATMLSPAAARRSYLYGSQPMHSKYFEYDRESFISSPSIPKTHMPHSALRRQVDRGWDYTHYPREMSAFNGRDSIKYSTWNDIY